MTNKSNAIQQHKKKAFIDAYSQTGNVTQAALVAEIDRSTHYAWMKSDEEYAKAFEYAEQQAADVLEKEARRRAVEGVEKPIFHRGKQVATVREYSDTLLIFLLKGAKPDKYRERVSSELTGKDGKPIEQDVNVIFTMPRPKKGDE